MDRQVEARELFWYVPGKRIWIWTFCDTVSTPTRFDFRQGRMGALPAGSFPETGYVWNIAHRLDIGHSGSWRCWQCELLPGGPWRHPDARTVCHSVRTRITSQARVCLSCGARGVFYSRTFPHRRSMETLWSSRCDRTEYDILDSSGQDMIGSSHWLYRHIYHQAGVLWRLVALDPGRPTACASEVYAVLSTP